MRTVENNACKENENSHGEQLSSPGIRVISYVGKKAIGCFCFFVEY